MPRKGAHQLCRARHLSTVKLTPVNDPRAKIISPKPTAAADGRGYGGLFSRFAAVVRVSSWVGDAVRALGLGTGPRQRGPVHARGVCEVRSINNEAMETACLCEPCAALFVARCLVTTYWVFSTSRRQVAAGTVGFSCCPIRQFYHAAFFGTTGVDFWEDVPSPFHRFFLISYMEMVHSDQTLVSYNFNHYSVVTNYNLSKVIVIVMVSLG